MRARDVVGRRIVAVRQTRTRDKCGDTVYHIDAIELDDGSLMWFRIAELGCDYAVEGKVERPPAKRRGHACDRVFFPADGSGVGVCKECGREWTMEALKREAESRRASRIVVTDG